MTDKYVVMLDSRVVDGEAMDPSEAKQFQRYLNDVFPDRNYTIARLEPVEIEPEPDTYQEITFTIHAENTATWDEVMDYIRGTLMPAGGSLPVSEGLDEYGSLALDDRSKPIRGFSTREERER